MLQGEINRMEVVDMSCMAVQNSQSGEVDAVNNVYLASARINIEKAI